MAETADKAGAKAQAAVQKETDDATAKGYRGKVADTTPNENYTVKGVLAGKNTPETTRPKP